MRDPERSASAIEASPEEEFSYLLSEASDRLQAGRLEEARAHLERALALRPGHEQARNLLGLSLFRLGRLDEAQALFQELVDDNPVEPSLRLNLAMVQLKAGHLEEARIELERVLDLNPGHVRAASYMGLVLERLGVFVDAAAWYEQAGQAERANEMRARQAELERDGDDDDDEKTDVDLGSLEGVPAPPPLDEVPAPPPLDDKTEEKLEEKLAESEVQAAALSALRAESLRRPLTMPSPVDLDEAEQVKLGFTLEVGADARAADTSRRPDEAQDEAKDEAQDELEDTAPPSERGETQGAAKPADVLAPPPPRAIAEHELLPVDASHGRFRGPLSLADLVVTRRVDAARDAPPSASLGGLLRFPVADIAYLRTDLLVSLAGDFEVEPLNRRYRGRRTDSLFGGTQAPMIAVMGEGLSWLDPGEREVTLLRLSNEELYLVESAVLAFSSGLVWENGRLPDEGGRDLDIVHLRGSGVVVLGTERPAFSLDVRPERPITLHAERLIGWNGSVVPSRGPLPGLPESAHRPPIVRFEGTGQVLGI